MNDREWSDVARGSSNQFAGFLVGLAVGAGIALLLAPASGSDTRRRLGETANRLGKDARDGMGTAREKMHDLADDAKSAIDSGRKAFQRVREGAEATVTEFGDTATSSRPNRV